MFQNVCSMFFSPVYRGNYINVFWLLHMLYGQSVFGGSWAMADLEDACFTPAFCHQISLGGTWGASSWTTLWTTQCRLRSMCGRRPAACHSTAWRSSWNRWPAKVQRHCRSSSRVAPPWCTSRGRTASTPTAQRWQGPCWSWPVL